MNPPRHIGRTHALTTLTAVAAFATLAVAPCAHAQTGSPNVVIAEQLFREGQDLLDASKADESKTHLACEKFAESERLRPALGTLLNLAVCHEKEKKTASAWAEYTEVAGQATRAGQADRAQFASQHAAALEHQLSRLHLEMASPPANTEVKIDGQALGAAAWGTDIPLDPGPHTLVVSAPNKQPWSRTVTLIAQQVDREQVPPLVDEVAHASTATEPDQAKSGRGALPYVVGGVGIAAVVVGGILIGRGAAYSSQSTDETTKAAKFPVGNVNHTNFTTAAASDHSAGTTNTVAGVVVGAVGLVGVGVGIYLLVSNGSSDAPPPPKAGAFRFLPDVGPGRAGGSVSLTF